MREIAIINTRKTDFSKALISMLPSDVRITVFRNFKYDYECGSNVTEVELPKNVVDSDSKVKNFVSKHYIDRGFKGYLHVIEDSVEILKDPMDFLENIEVMMDKLNLKSWFNTITDVCNYTFKMYNPRVSIQIDEPKSKAAYDKTIYWTSHSNTSWVCYDLSKATFEDIRFDEQFSIAMFYIIEFLARRRNSKKPGELYYMNYYPTIMEERGVFRIKNEHFDDGKTDSERQKTMQTENEIFTKMNINHQADIPVEPLMDDLYNWLSKEK